MPLQSFATLLAQYRYWIVIPLSLVEGPTVALVVGMLASFGLFNLPAAFGIFVAKDMLVDGAYYYLGRFAGERSFVARVFTRARITPADIERIRSLWMRRGWRTMFVGKLSWGLSPAFLALAGIVRLPAPFFFVYAVGVALLQYALLLLAGYYFGHALGALSQALRVVQYLLVAVAVATVVYIRWRLRAARPEPERD